MHETTPVYLRGNISCVSSRYSRTRSSSHNLYLPSVKGTSSNSVYFRGIQDWNSLTINVKSDSNYISFKIKVRGFLATRSLGRQQMILRHSIKCSSHSNSF